MDVYNDLQYNVSNLFIDTRPQFAYNKNHIRHAVNLPISLYDQSPDALQVTLFARLGEILSNKRFRITKVILYGDTQFESLHKIDRLIYQRCSSYISSEIEKDQRTRKPPQPIQRPTIIILECPFADFERKYPYLCTDSAVEPVTARTQMLATFLTLYMNRKFAFKEKFKVYPAQILEDIYFLGNANHSSDSKLLQKLQITHIINCTRTLPNHFESHSVLESADSNFNENTNDELDAMNAKYTAKYIRVPVHDVQESDIKIHFVSAIKFITETLSENDNLMNRQKSRNRILCHCHAGISRSSTVTVAYLMFALNTSMEVALQWVTSCRPMAKPNPGFMAQLTEFEHFLDVKRAQIKDRDLIICDLGDFLENKSEIEQKSSLSASNVSPSDEPKECNESNESKHLQIEVDLKSLGPELRRCVEHCFNGLQCEQFADFMTKYGSTVTTEYPEMFGILIEDILLNQNNRNRQIFVLLIVEMFKQGLSCNRDSFVNDTLCGYLANRFLEESSNSLDSIQFLAALFAHLMVLGVMPVSCIETFVKNAVRTDFLATTTGEIWQRERAQIRCSKLILCALKELDLMKAVQQMRGFKSLCLRGILSPKVFSHSDAQYLNYFSSHIFPK